MDPLSIFGRAKKRIGGVAALAGVMMLIAAPPPANAATSFTVTNVGATVSGTSVTASATIKTSAATTAQLAGICARDSQNQDRDFPLSSSVLIPVAGVTMTKTATFAAGVYQYFACVYVGGVWTNLGTPKTFTVSAAPASAPPASAPPPSSAAPSGVAMPTGNLSGWTQTFTEDFTKTVARGSFPGPYGTNWLSYNGFTDTSAVGDYDQRIISAQNGTLDLYLHTENGRPKGAAPIPLVNGKWGGQSYGRFSIRMKSDSLPGYGTGFLLWTDSGNWADGEIDFPESGLADVVKGYNHCPGNPSKNCLVVNSTARYTSWHTYTIEWRPERLSFLIDGAIVGTTTSNIPSKPLHWVMQVATTGVKPAATTAGHLLIDWVTIHRMA
jgi:hypothetical protein